MNRTTLYQLITFTLFWFAGLHVFGQPADTLTVQKLLDRGYNLEIENPDSALKVYSVAAETAHKIDYKIGEGRALQYTGIVYSDQGKYDKAIEFYQKAIEVFKSIPYPAGIASTYVNIGNIYKRRAEYAKAIDNYLEGTRLFEQIGDTSRVIYAYTNIGSVLSDVEQYEKSQEYNHRSLELSTLLRDSTSICDGLANIGSVEFNMGNFDRAKESYQKALSIAEITKDIYMLYLINISLSNIEAESGNYKAANETSENALHFARVLGNPALISTAMTQTGSNYMNLEHLDSAAYFLKKSIELAQENQAQEVLISAYKWMGELQEKRQNYKSALEWNKQYEKLQQKATGERKKRIVAGLEIEFETEKKDLELKEQSIELERNEALLAKRNYFIIALIGALVSALVFFFLVRRSLRQKKLIAEKDTAIQQEKVLQLKKNQQVIALKSMMEGEEKERQRMAKDLHDGLGGMLSSVKMHFGKIAKKNSQLQASADYKKALELLDTTSSEARKISHNLMPGALVKFGLIDALNDFCNNISGSHRLNIDFQSYGLNRRLPEDKEIMIYRIVQELVNNVVKHAEATELIVQLMASSNTLHITVEDDGKGFDPEKLKTFGIGMNNIHSRVEYLTGKLKIDSKTGVGTTTSIVIPLD